ncbi:MAG: hypothetical protein RSC68_31705 [Acinetobacter sp.]
MVTLRGTAQNADDQMGADNPAPVAGRAFTTQSPAQGRNSQIAPCKVADNIKPPHGSHCVV